MIFTEQRKPTIIWKLQVNERRRENAPSRMFSLCLPGIPPLATPTHQRKSFNWCLHGSSERCMIMCPPHYEPACPEQPGLSQCQLQQADPAQVWSWDMIHVLTTPVYRFVTKASVFCSWGNVPFASRWTSNLVPSQWQSQQFLQRFPDLCSLYCEPWWSPSDFQLISQLQGEGVWMESHLVACSIEQWHRSR